MRKVIALGFVPGFLLVAILIASFGLRVWGSGFGLPAYTRYHADEWNVVEPAAAVLRTGDWNTHSFNYPPLYAYVQAVADAAYFLWGAARGMWEYVMPFTLPQFYHVGRMVTALVGTLTVLVVYLAGRNLHGRRTGLLAAALLGGCYLHVIHSHYATVDVMLAFLVSLVYLFSELIRTRSQTRWYVLAGLCAGLAGATKYNGAAAIVMPFIAHVLVTRWGEWGWLDGRLLSLLGTFVIGFFGGNPFALGSMPEFLNGLAQVLHHYGTQQPGFEGRGNWRWYIQVFLTSADAMWVVAGFLGLVRLIWKDWRRGLVLVGFPLLYYLMVSRFVVRFERNMVPILPFLAIAGALLMDELGERLARRFKRGIPFSHGLAGAGAILVIAAPLLAGILFDVALSKTDLREAAGRWVMDAAHIQPGSKIAIEEYSIPFDPARYRVENVVRISDHDLLWYQLQGFDVLIISDGVWEVLRRQPDAYRGNLAVYDQLTSGSTLLAKFVPKPPGIVVAGYPTVAVYHFAPVRIYGVPR